MNTIDNELKLLIATEMQEWEFWVDIREITLCLMAQYPKRR
jgi:hypothetical protein